MTTVNTKTFTTTLNIYNKTHQTINLNMYIPN